MVNRSNRSRRSRALLAALAVLLAPALVTACGPAKETHQDAAPGAASSPPGGPSSSAPSASAPVSPSPAPGTGTPPGPAPTQPGPSLSTVPAPPPPPHAALPLIRSTASGGRTVALTFDDGPGPATGQILDLLAKYGAHATFCEIGPQAAADPAIVQRIIAEGHRLCDHTVHHPQPMHTLSLERQVYEITAAKDMITGAGGPGTRVGWFRAPGGDFSAANVQIASQDGMRSLSWSVDPRDWSRPGAPAIVANVEHNLRPGGVVLLHDGGGDRSQTVAAVGQLLPWLVSRGYTFDFPVS